MHISLGLPWPEQGQAPVQALLWDPLQQHPLAAKHSQLLSSACEHLALAVTKAAMLELHETSQSILLCLEQMHYFHSISHQAELCVLNTFGNAFQKRLKTLQGCCPENMRPSACQTPREATTPRNTMPYEITIEQLRYVRRAGDSLASELPASSSHTQASAGTTYWRL